MSKIKERIRTMQSLTDKQKAILRFIYTYRYDFDMSPTVYDIADLFGLKIPSVLAHLSSLVTKGLITKSGKARSIKLIISEELLAVLSVPVSHNPGIYSIPVTHSPFDKQVDNQEEFIFDGRIYPKLIGEFKSYALAIDENNQSLSDNLKCGDLLLINPEMVFISEKTVILSICNGKLSLCRCIEWSHEEFVFIPWCKDESAAEIRGDQADIVLLGNVIGLHRTNLY